MSITIRQIERFVLLCKHRNFTDAANDIGLSQAGLSLLIQSLERAFGDRLIDRTSRSLALTEIGQGFLPIAERMLEDLDLALSPRAARGRPARITLAALPTLAATIVPAAISAFRRDHPDVAIQVRDALTSEIIERVRSGDAHIGIGAFGERPDDLFLQPLLRDRLVAFAHTTLLPEATEIRWRDLKDEPLILMDRDSNIRVSTDHVFTQLRATVSPAFETRYITTATAFARERLGVAIIPAMEARAFTRPDTRVVELVEPQVVRDIGVLSRKSASPSTYTKALIACLERCAMNA